MSIETIDQLREHLQIALQVEHATIPPYLCALYSLMPGTNNGVATVLQTVVMEEMLHMVQVANLLSAVGGRPRLTAGDFIPVYPAYLPHSRRTFTVSLRKFGREAVETFLKIEQPRAASAPPESHGYTTLGQFYLAIQQGLEHVCDGLGEQELFRADPDLQVGGEHYYGGNGRLHRITDMASARQALLEIVEQGEGYEHERVSPSGQVSEGGPRPDPAHYFRFEEILRGRSYRGDDTVRSGPTGPELPVDWDAVYDMRTNPRAADYPRDSPIWRLLNQFNRTYGRLLERLEAAFNGQPDLLVTSVALMYELKYQAAALMRIPSGYGTSTVGPSFEYIPLERAGATGAQPAHHSCNGP